MSIFTVRSPDGDVRLYGEQQYTENDIEQNQNDIIVPSGSTFLDTSPFYIEDRFVLEGDTSLTIEEA